MTNPLKLDVSELTDQHIEVMMTWFDTEAKLRAWSGPFFDYPFTRQTFEKSLTKNNHLNVVLHNDMETVAFGQCYLRLERVHLARLVVSPNYRGRKIVNELIAEISHASVKPFGLRDLSLFVLENNMSAIKAYEKCGFELRDYPEENPLENCLYMVKAVRDIES